MLICSPTVCKPGQYRIHPVINPSNMKIHLIFLAIAVGMVSIGCHSSKKTVAASTKSGGTGSNLPGSFDYERLDDYTFKLSAAADDSTYGYTAQNPIHVGGAMKQEGPSNQRRYLNALKGPNGESITYFRKGSCCPFSTKNGIMGGGMLDRYEVTWENNSTPYILYIDMYDAAELKAPKGFTFKD